MYQDSLEELPKDKCSDLQRVFKGDWPRGISGYWALETQKQWLKLGLKHNFKVYCPFGDVTNGMVAINQKNSLTEIIIQCPSDNTTRLEDALRKTKLIDWTKTVTIPFSPQNVVQSIKNIQKDINVEITQDEHFNELVVLEAGNPLFDVCLPEGVTFEQLSEEHLDQVDSSWVNRYNTSSWYFKLLMNAHSAYGLVKEKELVCWVFVSEVGSLTHLFTMEQHRKKGYAVMLLRLVCNRQLRESKDTFAYCRVGNQNALNLYMKLGFKKYHSVLWFYLIPKSKVNI